MAISPLLTRRWCPGTVVQPGAEKDFDRVIELDSDFDGVSVVVPQMHFTRQRCAQAATERLSCVSCICAAGEMGDFR